MPTARSSPRCAGSGQTVGEEPPGKVVDCKVCGRPVRLQKPNSRIPSHGTLITRNTKAADERMRHVQQMQREYPDTIGLV